MPLRFTSSVSTNVPLHQTTPSQPAERSLLLQDQTRRNKFSLDEPMGIAWQHFMRNQIPVAYYKPHYILRIPSWNSQPVLRQDLHLLLPEVDSESGLQSWAPGCLVAHRQNAKLPPITALHALNFIRNMTSALENQSMWVSIGESFF